MSRLVRPVALAILVLGLAGCGGGETPRSSGDAGSTGGDKFPDIKACEVYTVDDARKFLGDGARPIESRLQTDMSGPEVNLSVCTYERDTGADLLLVTVLVRAPKADSALRDNEEAFGNARPADAQDVSGYGEKAYFDKNLKQLAVLKNGVFLIFTPPSESSDALADSKRIADVVLPRI
jgi:hypothetical protein